MAYENRQKTFMIEDANILPIPFRNFEGREGQFNRKGEKSFVVTLPQDIAEQMEKDGWNVRYLKPRDEDDEPTPSINIGVRFDIRPPRVVMITSTARTVLDNDSIEVLDWADIRVADLIARGHDWDVNGKSGTKAYLQSLFVTIEEDALELKYAIRSDEDL